MTRIHYSNNTFAPKSLDPNCRAYKILEKERSAQARNQRERITEHLMEYLSFQNLSFSELEADIVEKWSFQYQDYYSFDSFIQYLKDMNKWVEFLFEQSKKFEVSPRAKFASVYYLFRYVKELERDLSKQKFVVVLLRSLCDVTFCSPYIRSMSEKMMDLHLICCACLMLSCKRFCGFTLSVDSLVENMGNRFSPKDFYACGKKTTVGM